MATGPGAESTPADRLLRFHSRYRGLLGKPESVTQTSSGQNQNMSTIKPERRRANASNKQVHPQLREEDKRSSAKQIWSR